MAKFTFGSKDPAGNAKGRAILFFIIVIVLVSIVIGYLLYRKHASTVTNKANLQGAPSIESIPGVGSTSTEYVKLQEQQNIQQAQAAEQQGTSAVPTITRTSYFGPGEFGSTAHKGCNPDELRRARAAGVTAEELRCKGCSLAELKAAGYTAGELAAAGYSAADLRKAGFTAAQLRQAGFTAAELKAAGFNANQLAAAGYSPSELPQAGFTGDDLKNAGINPASAGIGLATPSNMPKDCSVAALTQARARGISAIALKKLGCGAAALRAAGYTAAELRAAGFTPEELRAGGYTAAELRAAGFTAGQLRRAGFSAADLKNAGFSAADLKNAGFSAADLKNAGFNANDLKAAGYTNGDLIRAGFSPVLPPSQPVNNCSIDALRQARSQGVSATALRAKGCSAAAMLAAGFTPAQLKEAGYSNDDLRAAGLTPAQIAALNPPPANQAPAVPGVSGSAAIPPVGNSETQLAQVQANQEQQLNNQQKQQKLALVESSMVSQANSLFTTWTPPATQQFVAGEAPKEITAVATTATAAATTAAAAAVVGGPVSGSGATAATDVPCAYVKGGDIMMAVLTSTVNSDENSPVMATIVSGKLRGAQLIGQFTLLKQKVLINFNKMNLPGKPASIGINAVAIDPNTAHTALADCVNNHYWLRYGTLFASSFLSGLADAISQQGSQTSTGSGGILVTHDPLSIGQTFAVALGAVGSQYASVLGSNFTRPPTVYVYAGDSIGVLFMQDLTEVPDKCCPNIDKTCNAIGSAASACGCLN